MARQAIDAASVNAGPPAIGARIGGYRVKWSDSERVALARGWRDSILLNATDKSVTMNRFWRLARTRIDAAQIKAVVLMIDNLPAQGLGIQLFLQDGTSRDLGPRLEVSNAQSRHLAPLACWLAAAFAAPMFIDGKAREPHPALDAVLAMLTGATRNICDRLRGPLALIAGNNGGAGLAGGQTPLADLQAQAQPDQPKAQDR